MAKPLGRWKNSKRLTIIESEVWRDLGPSGQKKALAQNKQEIDACSKSIKQVSAEIAAKAALTESSREPHVDRVVAAIAVEKHDFTFVEYVNDTASECSSLHMSLNRAAALAAKTVSLNDFTKRDQSVACEKIAFVECACSNGSKLGQVADKRDIASVRLKNTMLISLLAVVSKLPNRCVATCMTKAWLSICGLRYPVSLGANGMSSTCGISASVSNSASLASGKRLF